MEDSLLTLDDILVTILANSLWFEVSGGSSFKITCQITELRSSIEKQVWMHVYELKMDVLF